MKKDASNAHIWTRCGGYIKAATDYVARYGYIQSRAADEGSMAHALAEHLISEMLRTGNPSPEVPDMWDEVVVPVDMKIKANDYAHFCYSMLRRAMIFGGPHIFLERKVLCRFLSEETVTRVDFAFYDKKAKKLIIVDFKYGHRPVKAESNPQLLIGARAIIDQLGIPVECVSMNIYQPNGPNASMPLDQWEQTGKEVFGHIKVIRELFHTEDDSLLPGSHCRYCEARGGCAAVKAALYESWDVMAHYNHIPEKLPTDILEKMMAECAQIKDLLRGYETGLEAMMVSRLKNGEVSTQWEYSTSLSARKWIYPEEDILDMGKSLGLDLESRKVLSPKQAQVAGVPKDVIDTLVRRDATGLKLRKKSIKTLKQAFGKD